MDLEQTAIQRLRAASEMALQVYKTPLVITDSGGKDSSICTHLAERAGIPFEVIVNSVGFLLVKAMSNLRA